MLSHMCAGVAAVNTSKDKSSDVQLREAAIQLAVFGVPLSDFDPWSLADPHLVGRGGELTLEAVKKAKKGMLSLSAATFVAPRTIRAPTTCAARDPAHPNGSAPPPAASLNLASARFSFLDLALLHV